MNDEINDKKFIKISEVTKAIGASRKALQEYDKMGLVHPTAKTEGGYWLYDMAAVEKIKTIQRKSPKRRIKFAKNLKETEFILEGLLNLQTIALEIAFIVELERTTKISQDFIFQKKKL